MVFINLGTIALSFGHCEFPRWGPDVRSSILLSRTRDCTRIEWRFLVILYTFEGKDPEAVGEKDQ